MDTANRPAGNRSGALTTVGGLASHMDPGYDEDWEVDIRRTQEDANTEVSQNRSSLFQRFPGYKVFSVSRMTFCGMCALSACEYGCCVHLS